jgi:hypothetical protein
MARAKARTFVVLINSGEVHGGTDSIIVHRGDRVTFANATEGVATILWKKNRLNATGCPFEWPDDESIQEVPHGHPLMMRVGDERSAPYGKYTYRLRVARPAGGRALAAGRGVGDGGGGGDVIIQP